MKKVSVAPSKFKTEQERIRYIFEQTEQTQLEFAAALGIGQPHLSGVMSTRKPSKRLLIMISEKTGANVDWLATGEGDVYKKDNRTADDPPELARVIEEARKMWDNLDDDVEKYELAAIMLRTLSARNKKNNSTLEKGPKIKK